jgi:hypothetical protein
VIFVAIIVWDMLIKICCVRVEVEYVLVGFSGWKCNDGGEGGDIILKKNSIGNAKIKMKHNYNFGDC